MSIATVEEIIAAVPKLSDTDRSLVYKVLQQGEKQNSQIIGKKGGLQRLADEFPLNQIPPSRDAEMQWLLDHPEFWEQHRGEHVALWGYEMIAVCKTRKEAVAKAHQIGIIFPFIQYIPEEEKEWLLGFSNKPTDEV